MGVSKSHQMYELRGIFLILKRDVEQRTRLVGLDVGDELLNRLPALVDGFLSHAELRRAIHCRRTDFRRMHGWGGDHELSVVSVGIDSMESERGLQDTTPLISR